jgi:hypothetical protein
MKKVLLALAVIAALTGGYVLTAPQATACEGTPNPS